MVKLLLSGHLLKGQPYLRQLVNQSPDVLLLPLLNGQSHFPEVGRLVVELYLPSAAGEWGTKRMIC